jgi:hypothetical protein
LDTTSMFHFGHNSNVSFWTHHQCFILDISMFHFGHNINKMKHWCCVQNETLMLCPKWNIDVVSKMKHWCCVQNETLMLCPKWNITMSIFNSILNIFSPDHNLLHCICATFNCCRTQWPFLSTLFCILQTAETLYYTIANIQHKTNYMC